ncbi:MAG: hypothetical protein SPG52_02360 [Candidatus Cryptobacteroides sp.]|nr:hypothetical protein [Candidatus Cryptobacteroides sp.]
MKKLLIILSVFVLMLNSCGNTNKKTEENFDTIMLHRKKSGRK